MLRFLLTFARIRLINATKRNQEVTVPGVVARLGIKTRLSDLQQAHVVLIPLTSARFIFLQPGQIEFTSRQGGARPSFFRLIRPLYTASYSPDSACARTIKTKPRRTCHDRWIEGTCVHTGGQVSGERVWNRRQTSVPMNAGAFQGTRRLPRWNIVDGFRVMFACWRSCLFVSVRATSEHNLRGPRPPYLPS